MTKYPLHLIDEIKNRKAPLKSGLKAKGMPLSEFSPTRIFATGKKKYLIEENPWKIARQNFVKKKEPADVEKPAEIAESESALNEPENSVSEDMPGGISSDEEPGKGMEKKTLSKPMTITEVFMAAKKSGNSAGKKSQDASGAISNAPDKQGKSSETTEKVAGKNITAETCKKKPAKKKGKKPLADIVDEVTSKVDRKKEAPKSAKSKQTTKTARRTATGESLAVPVEGLAIGVINTLGDAVGGVVNAGVAVGSAAVSGVKKASAKVETAVSSAKGERGEKKGGAFDAALNTATRVTGKVANGIKSTGSGAATVAGYTAKGAVGIVNDSVNGVLNWALGPKKKKDGQA